MEPILNAGLEYMDNQKRDRGIAPYLPATQLLTSYMENGESRLKFAKRQAALDLWVGVFGAIMALNITGRENYT